MTVLQSVSRSLLKRVVGVCTACLVGLAAIPAQAAFITYVFDSPLTSVAATNPIPVPPPMPGSPPPPPPMGLPLQLPPELSDPISLFGERMSGFVTVTDMATDFNPDPARGSFSGFGILPLFSVTLAGNTFALDRTKPGSQSFVTVSNLDTPPVPGLPPVNFVQLRSSIGTGFFPTGTPAADYAVELLLTFSTQDLGIITTDGLPPDLTVFPNFMLNLSIIDRSRQATVQYQSNVELRRLMPPAAVPEPGTLAMLGLGILSLAFALRLRCN